MTQEEDIVERLRELCAREGGPVAVADKAGVSDQNLKQVLGGVKLPSGRPRGVGPNLRRKLDAAFPGWRAPAASAPRAAEPLPVYDPTKGTGGMLLLALDVVLRAIADVPPVRWPALQATLAQLVGHPEMLDDVLPEVLALLEARPGKRDAAAA